MPYTPSGPLAERYDALRTTIAYSATFQSLTNSATEAMALERIIFPDMADLLVDECDPSKGLKYPRTRAIVSFKEDQWSILPTGRGVSDEEYPTVLRLEIIVPSCWEGTDILDNDVIRNYWCDEQWRAIVQDIIAASRLSVHPISGEKFVADSASFSVEREGLIDVTLPKSDLVHETFYAAEITITDASGV